MKNLIDFFKTGIIFFLTVSMLTLAGLYINARQNAGQGEEIPWEKMPIFAIGGMSLAEINENHITPLQITITISGSTFTAVYNDKSVLNIYEYGIKYSIRDIFGKNSECRVLDQKEGNELWAKCAKLDKSVYIKYAGDYIYPFIYTFLDKEWNIKNSAGDFSGDLAMVHELFIIDEGEPLGVARDTYGRVSVFTPVPETKNKIKQRIGSAGLSACKNISGVVPCYFLKNGDINAQTGFSENDIINLKFSESFHLFQNYDRYSFVLEFSNPIFDEENKINTDHAYIKNLFKNLNFNIENSASYSEGDGVTFRDSKNTVKFYNSGKIVYNHKLADSGDNGGGLHLAKFLSYDANYYTYYEKIKAASVFVKSLDGELTGNECKIYLKNISIDSNGDMKMSFSYYYEGAEIKIDGSNEAIVLTLNENSFTQIEINSIYIKPDGRGMVKNRNPVFDLKMIDREISKELETSQSKEETARKYKMNYDETSGKFIVSDFRLVYNIDYKSVENNTVKAVWELS